MSPARTGLQRFLKNWTARSCFCAAPSDENVPKFLRLPVFASFLREYSRYFPDFILRIMKRRCVLREPGLETLSHEVLGRGMMHHNC